MDTTGRRETHVRDDDADHEDEGRDRVLAHAERGRKKRDAQREGDGRDDLDEVVDLLVDGSLFRFLRGTTPSRHCSHGPVDAIDATLKFSETPSPRRRESQLRDLANHGVVRDLHDHAHARPFRHLRPEKA